MNALTIVILSFSVLSAVDYIIGNKFGLGEEFKKGFMLLGTMALSMIGMIIISPLIASLIEPALTWIYNTLKIDPSIIPASLFANDMGGAPLAVEVAKNENIGNFNALVVSSMMGATISFTIPFAIEAVNKEHHKYLALGLLCGVVTIPIGCLVSGFICRIPFLDLVVDLLPLVVLSIIIALGLIFFPDACVKIFKAIGFFIKILIIVGLLLGIINFLFDKEIVKGLGTIEEGTMVCMNASIVMSGMFPLISIISRLLSKPLLKLGKKVEMDGVGILGIISTLATNVTTLGKMNEMNNKSIIINSAFAVSAAFTFAGHLAFTMAFNADYLLPRIVGKLVAGVLALILANILYNKNK